MPIAPTGRKLRQETVLLFHEGLLQSVCSVNRKKLSDSLGKEEASSMSMTSASVDKTSILYSHRDLSYEAAVDAVSADLLQRLQALLEQDRGGQSIQITADMHLHSLFDSVQAMEAKGILEHFLGEVPISNAEIIMYDTVNAISDLLVCKYRKLPLPSVQMDRSSDIPIPSRSKDRPGTGLMNIYQSDGSGGNTPILDSSSRSEVVVSGISCRFPDRVCNLADLWTLLNRGQVAGQPSFVNQRWQLSEEDVLEFAQVGGVRDDSPMYESRVFLVDNSIWERFDAEFFGLSAEEAGMMSTQQRVSLQLVWESMVMAGAARRDATSVEDLHGLAAGVFVGGGVATSTVVASAQGTALGDVKSMLTFGERRPSSCAEIIANLCGFYGPAQTLDCGCVSGIAALSVAQSSLLSGDVDYGLVVSVQSLLEPLYVMAQTKLGMLSETGQCLPFAESRNGFMASEAAVGMVLARKSFVKENKLTNLGTIRSISVVQSGRRKLEINPVEAQERCVTQALKKAGLHPNSISYVEPHGTGSKVGDGLELRTLLSVYGAREDGSMVLGAHKSVLGHPEQVSSLSSLVVAILSLHKRQTPRYPNIQSADPMLLQTDALVLPTTSLPLDNPEGGSVFAAVHSYGIGGHIGHLILEVGDNVDTEKLLQQEYQWREDKSIRCPLQIGSSQLQSHKRRLDYRSAGIRQQGDSENSDSPKIDLDEQSSERREGNSTPTVECPFPASLLRQGYYEVKHSKPIPPPKLLEKVMSCVRLVFAPPERDEEQNKKGDRSSIALSESPVVSELGRSEKVDVNSFDGSTNLLYEGLTSAMAVEVRRPCS